MYYCSLIYSVYRRLAFIRSPHCFTWYFLHCHYCHRFLVALFAASPSYHLKISKNDATIWYRPLLITFFTFYFSKAFHYCIILYFHFRMCCQPPKFKNAGYICHWGLAFGALLWDGFSAFLLLLHTACPDSASLCASFFPRADSSASYAHHYTHGEDLLTMRGVAPFASHSPRRQHVFHISILRFWYYFQGHCVTAAARRTGAFSFSLEYFIIGLRRCYFR